MRQPLGEYGHAEAARLTPSFNRPDVCRGLCGRGGDCLQGDFEAELLELADETTGSSLRVFAGSEVVVTKVLVDLSGAEQVPDERDQRVGDSHGRLIRTAAASDLTVLGAEVAALGPCCGSGGLDQRAPQPGIALGGPNPAALAGGFVAARADADP